MQKKRSPEEQTPETETVEQTTEAEVEQDICFDPAEMLRVMKLVEEKNQLLEEQTDRLKRLQADFDNFRRRTKIEKEELAQVVTESIVLKLLPVIDNFERACSVGSTQDAASILEGVVLIYKQMMATLENMGIQPIKAVGAAFDPNLHEAVSTEQNEESPEGTILQEFQRGYTLGAKAIRPSMVKVSIR